MGIAVLSALAVAAPIALADSVPKNSTDVGPVSVRVYSQMCDGGSKKPLHTRLNVKNNSSTPQTVSVQDSYATKIVYDPPGPISPGVAMLVHITAPRTTPAHTITVIAGGTTGTVAIPKSPCTPDPPPPTTDPTTATTKPPITGGTTPTTGPYVPPTGPIDPDGGTPVGSPGVVNSPGLVGRGTGAGGSVRAASTGTLPFTGSDIRAFALLGDLLVLIGFVLLLVSHRSPRAGALLKKLTPKRLSLDEAG